MFPRTFGKHRKAANKTIHSPWPRKIKHRVL